MVPEDQYRETETTETNISGTPLPTLNKVSLKIISINIRGGWEAKKG